ncbi:Vitamin-D-receptor interacting Mediator subunit 4 [Geosmithia morbida]|uniref:Mediator of RNA polymerase II transcription subunit 4 n=1 Tax=Geosmithia morbida TaxID=1094350 RepID=A0A9P4Z583_9HYPO|nr:Vitamin-D-receptor interacting Mediator subunit 4 [Geosmithia morbida]KAF4126914.1 Vitamin-D-receptor interacting Mediator subunit 4 [Geosmithia morbida]
MDTFIDGRFERLQRALASLIDSVNKYHPSTIQAGELQAADEDLCRGLEQVQTHQINHLRIQQLRKSSTALDDQIKDTLSSLASTRRDISTTHTTTFPDGPNYPVTYEELLSYARRISKTTMAPAGAVKPPPSTAPAGMASPDIQTPMTTASAAPTPSQPQSPSVTNGPAAGATATATATAGAGSWPSSTPAPATAQPQNANITLPDVVSQYLNPLSGQLFFPWPPEEKIRGGALASNQILEDKGIDPRGYDPAEEEERLRREDEARKEKEERDRLEVEERERRAREERERMRQERERQQEEWRKASISDASPGTAGAGAAPADAAAAAPAPAAPAEKKQFQFTSLDDLDDDDDD